MALTQGDRDEIAEMIGAALAGQVKALQCTAQYPHEGKLRWVRGPNYYICECGKQYIKGGLGTLINRPAEMIALEGGR